jgi:hypothetical protein
VEWPRAAETALTVPIAAVRGQGQLQTVFVIENGIAHARMVTLGEMRDGRYRVDSGLKAGEEIVQALTDAVNDGVSIEVQR